MDNNLKNIINAIKPLIMRNPLLFRYLSYLLTSIIISSLPIMFFIIFMGEKSFFSYDFFTQGLFGMKVFFFFTLFIILAISLFMFSSILLFIRIYYLKEKIKSIKEEGNKDKIKEYNIQKKSISNFTTKVFICNFLFFILLLYTFCLNGSLGLFAFLVIIVLLISVHIGIVLFGETIHQFFSLMLLVTLIIFFTTLNSSYTAQVIDIGLKQFGVGGNIQISVFPKISNTGEIKNEGISGTLILMTPKHIYFKLKDKESIRIMGRENIYAIKIQNYSL